MITPKEHVIGLLRAMGPCTIEHVTYELITQAQGDWDTAPNKEVREIRARWKAVEVLNELMREGKAVLYETGDAFDYNYEEEV